MRTDELFYELFTIDPRSLFRLLRLEFDGEYRFDSITFKAVERRLDGFCHRVDGAGPNLFVEIQGYDDPKIYWRLFQEICLYYQQHDDLDPFVAIALFLDDRYDPGDCPFSQVNAPHQFLRATLQECLQDLSEAAGALSVLQPLTCTNKAQVFEHIHEWTGEIRSLDLPDEKIQTLLELLEYVIVGHFPTMSRKEIERMLHLTPIEDTQIGQELKELWTKEGQQKGEKKGLNKGLTKGELIGEIRATQKFLKRPVTPTNTLAQKSLKSLKSTLKELEAELADFN